MSLSTRSIRRIVSVPALAFIALLAGAGLVCAQPVDNDYYGSRRTPLLRTVEQYHLGPAEEKFMAKQYQSAHGDLTFMLRYFPNHPRALLLMAQLCSEWKSPRCLPDMMFEKAIQLKPDESATYIVQGIYLHRIKRYKDAIASYEQAVALDQDSINAHYNLALTLVETRQFELANQHAQRAYALGAQLPGLRQRLQKAGQWKPAEGPVPQPAPAPQSQDADPK